MNSTDDINDPFDFEQTWLKELREMYETLKGKHARRKRSPLIFVETFKSIEECLHSFERSGWDTVDKELGYLKQLIERLRPDYQLCLNPAEAQRKRNELWERMYGKSDVWFVEGGRADGNS